MLITLTQLKKSLQALKDFLLAKIPLKTSDLTNDSNFITADDAVQDVQIDVTSIVDNGVAVIPVASNSSLGVVRGGNYGVKVRDTDGQLVVDYASEATVKSSAAYYNPIVPRYQHTATFYGLAKAAGDTTQSASSNAVGTYTDEAKSAIKTMLGIDTITVDSIPTTEIDTLFA